MSSCATDLRHLFDVATATLDAKENKAAVMACCKAIYDAVCAGRDSAQAMQRALDVELCAQQPMARLRLVQYCTQFLYDKPRLPSRSGELDHFLWMFAVPFTVTFSAGIFRAPFGDGVVRIDAEAIQVALDASSYFPKTATLRGTPRLYRREDLQNMDPRELARYVLDRELASRAAPTPLPLPLTDDLEGVRTVAFFVLMAARVPVGTPVLFENRLNWPKQQLEQIAAAGLRSQGLRVDSVVSHPAYTVATMLHRCYGPAAEELRLNLKAGLSAYGEHSIGVRHFGHAGYSEVYGLRPDGANIVLIPPFSHFESQSTVAEFVQELCGELGVRYLGASNPKITLSAALH